MTRERLPDGRFVPNPETPTKQQLSHGKRISQALDAIRTGEKVVHRRGLRKTDSRAVLQAITQEAYTSSELVHMIRETYDIAREDRQWAGMLKVITLVVEYAVGKPVHRTLTASINPDEILALLQDAPVDEYKARQLEAMAENGYAIDGESTEMRDE